MEEEVVVIGIAQKYNRLAWELIGGGLFAFAAIAALISYYGFVWDKSLIAIAILGWIGFVPLYYGIRHLMLPSILIAADGQYVYMVHRRNIIEKIAMKEIKSIFPSSQLGESDEHMGGIEITTYDGQIYIRDRIMFRYEVIQVLADKIYKNTGNAIDYYTLKNLDGSAVFEDK